MAGTKRGAGDVSVGDDVLSCGICLANVEDQGCLDSCEHVYCFECIMKWSQVESRCPTCKRRFQRVTRASVTANATASAGANKRGSLRRPRAFNIPLKDQVYHPSEEELAVAMQPYAHTLCMRCLESDNEHLLLLCDLCDNAAHTYCVGLGQEVPAGDWFCAACEGTAGASTSGSDTSVSVASLGESSGSGSEEEEGTRHQGRSPRAAAGASDADSDPEFRLDIHFDAAPMGSDGGGGAQRVRRPQRTLGGQGAAARLRQGRGGRGERGAVVAAGAGMGRQAQGRGGGGRPRRRAAREGAARTLQAEVGARLQLQFVRDSWPAIQAGTLSFPLRTRPSPPPRPAVASPPPRPSAASAAPPSTVEQMAWKALRALQSGQAQEGRRQWGRSSTGGTPGNTDRKSGAAPPVQTAQSRRPKERGARRSVGSAGAGGRRVGAPGAAAGVAETGPSSAAAALDERAALRRQANAGWVDEAVGMHEQGWGWERRDRGRDRDRGKGRGAAGSCPVGPCGGAVGMREWRSGGAEMPVGEWAPRGAFGGVAISRTAPVVPPCSSPRALAKGGTQAAGPLTAPLLRSPPPPPLLPPTVRGDSAQRAPPGVDSQGCGAQEEAASGRGLWDGGAAAAVASPTGAAEEGMARAKRVKDQVAEAVKQRLEPLYRDRSVDKIQFRKAAEGSTRALLHSPPAQTLYAKLKQGIDKAEMGETELSCWGCNRRKCGSETVGLPFCRVCVDSHVDAQVALLRRPL